MADKKTGKKPVKSKKESESEEELDEPETSESEEEDGADSEESESESEESESESEESEESEEDDDESDESEESESESESESEKKDKLVQITKDFEPRPPTNPVPVGYEDCFGKYHDPDAPECQPKTCLERDNCREVMKIRQSENETKKGTKMKKSAKKTEGKKASKKDVSESESEVEVKTSKKSKKVSESESESEKPTKKKSSKSKKDASESEKETKKKKSSKTGKVSEAVTTLLEKSGFEKVGGELKYDKEKDVLRLMIDDRTAASIFKASRDDGFRVEAKFKEGVKLSKLGLDKANWEIHGGQYANWTGEFSKELIAQLKEYFKLKAAAAKGGSESEK